MRVTTESAAETQGLAERIGGILRPGDVLTLVGEMGAGKTTFTQGLCRGLGVEEPVSSPTFALVHEYLGRTPVWHLDTYRIRSTDELIDLGWDDLLAGRGVVLVEWPERIAEALPEERLEVRLEYGPGDRRELELVPHGEAWARRLEGLGAEADGDGCKY